MNLIPLGIEGAWLAESPVWSDERGSFREWFKAEDVKSATGRDFGIEQANISVSSAGTLRGIHYSIAPRGQAKWITCVSGSIQDVVVDIRPDSNTFGQWVDVDLKGDSGKAVLISEGLGHGFLSLENNTIVTYLITTKYSPDFEHEVDPLDENLGISWRMTPSTLKISSKDKSAPNLSDLQSRNLLPTLKKNT
jgi:dTDP-4-dehydrorhamnose 3,5-epimerase